jgi:hypothetical protein
MKLLLSILSVFLLNNTVFSQQITGKELLDKALTYHDPNGNWATFNGVLNVTMETPNGLNRDSEIKINLPKEYFYVKATRDTLTTEYILNKEDCTITINGENNLSDETLKKHKLSCERANMYKNYYTYLYGLPMKLNDPGTNIHEKVERKNFKGKEYLMLKATYDKNIGSDIWYFYFNPKTYAMEIYQFFHIDKDTKKETGGEYILLTGEKTINGIKMPKNRAWYTNKDNKLLGTDILKK